MIKVQQAEKLGAGIPLPGMTRLNKEREIFWVPGSTLSHEEIVSGKGLTNQEVGRYKKKSTAQVQNQGLPAVFI